MISSVTRAERKVTPSGLLFSFFVKKKFLLPVQSSRRHASLAAASCPSRLFSYLEDCQKSIFNFGITIEIRFFDTLVKFTFMEGFS